MEKSLLNRGKIQRSRPHRLYKKGYAGTKTRDIAEQAGLNLALLKLLFS